MAYEITRRQWEQLVDRISKLEAVVRRVEAKVELVERRLKPSEIYRIVKQQETEEAVTSSVEIPSIIPKTT